ncbi:hypothetical protein C2845_PM14G01560 [Panicum miliaceum]|uniref:Uncharacterized protein n=1 Tax=Panicum miliaceum TaxID=4540 RepID=A0A3L6PMC9_PANMI|nr:hypothetical protein C2845_PM14G01560 [Panicum miliaceum]
MAFQKPVSGNDEEASFRAGNFALGERIPLLAQRIYMYMYGFTRIRLTIGLTLIRSCVGVWRAGTCALVACIVCLEAVHRLEHEKVHDEGKAPFPGTLMAEALEKLFDERSSDGTWKQTGDTYVRDVLGKMQEMKHLLKTDDEPARVLPLSSWQEYRWDDDDDDDSGAGLSPELVADLLDRHVPCVGSLWTCPWYGYFDAGRDDTLVYRGCGGVEDDMEESEKLYGKDMVGSPTDSAAARCMCSCGTTRTRAPTVRSAGSTSRSSTRSRHLVWSPYNTLRQRIELIVPCNKT